MNKPKALCTPQIRIPPEAAEQQVSGLALVRCVIEVDGTPCDCKALRSLPYMDEALLDATDGMQFEPVLYKGHPQRVELIIPLRIQSPPASRALAPAQ